MTYKQIRVAKRLRKVGNNTRLILATGLRMDIPLPSNTKLLRKPFSMDEIVELAFGEQKMEAA